MATTEPTYSTRAGSQRVQRHESEYAVKPLSVSEQFRKIGRHKGIFASVLLLCLLLSAIAGMFVKPSYEAKSTVVAYQLPTDPGNPNTIGQRIDIETESSVASSKEVTNAAAAKLNPDNENLGKQIRSNMQVSGHSQTAVMDIFVTNSDPQKAADMANAVAQSYLDVRSQHMQDAIKSASDNAQAQIDASGSDEAKKVLNEKKAQIQVTSTNPGRIVSQASAPSDSQSRGMPIYLAIGAVTGLLLGALAAYLADRGSKKVAYSDRFEEISARKVSVVPANNKAEGMRRVLRRIGAPEGDLAAAGLGGITVYSTDSALSSEVYEELKQVLPAKSTNFATASAFESIESGSSVKRVVDAKTPIVIETAADTDLSKLLLAAEATGALLVVANSSSNHRELKEFFDSADFSESTTVVPVFLNEK